MGGAVFTQHPRMSSKNPKRPLFTATWIAKGSTSSVPPPDYWNYLGLLRCLVAGGRAANILNAEMTLFANAPSVAEAFAAQCD